MKYIYLVGFLFLSTSFFSQNSSVRKSFINHDKQINVNIPSDFFQFTSIDSLINLKPGNDYNATRKNIEAKKIQFANSYTEAIDSVQKQQILDSVLIYFTDQLINHIIPYWYGTKWEFSGYTPTPGKGAIACGYFVSTTLKHMGLNLNRYKLAQAGAADEARYLSIKKHNLDHLIYSRSGDSRNVLDIFNRLPEGLYFVGLDFHVGYLLKKNNSLLFIHSNYIDGKVMAEHAYQSEAFRSSHYYFTRISGNKTFAKVWLLGTKFNTEN